MINIKEWLVVEGKHDSANILKYFKVNIIETSGTGLNKKTKELIKKVSENNEIIVFTDPDSAGQRIRTAVEKIVPKCKHAFISSDSCQHHGKVGIEFAGEEDLKHALKNVVSLEDINTGWTIEDLIDLRIIGDKTKRKTIGDEFKLGDCYNNKVLLKRLNGFKIDREDVKKVLNVKD